MNGPEHNHIRTVRIFISSPGDVREERERARDVVHQLRRRYAGQLELQAVLWEELPLSADMSFQQGIDTVLSANGVDIAVFILWSRLGSPTGILLTDGQGKYYRSGTEREWDMMLQARARCRRENASIIRPAVLVYTRKDDGTFEERLRGKSDDEKAAEIEQKRALTQFITEEFTDAETGINVRAYHSFDRPTTFAQQLRIHLTGQLDELVDQTISEPIWKIEEQGPPFRGLDVFEFEHAPIFFGREDEIVHIRTRLREQAGRGCAFVLISGPSGSGKSSLARAGVLPDVCNYEIDKSVGQWRRLIVRPGELGSNLVHGLVSRLTVKDAMPELAKWKNDLEARNVDGSPLNATDYIRWLTRFELRIVDALRSSGPKQSSARLIVLIDQLEELFSDRSISDTERERLFETLETLARSGSVWILATLRSDFYHHCQTLPALVRMMDGSGHFDLLSPTPDALVRVITGPAALAGLRFGRKGDLALSDVILREAFEHKELMPLVEDLLRELCERRSDDGELKFEYYTEVGGILGSLKHRCETVFRSLSPQAQYALDDMLGQLVSVSGDGQNSYVRRTVPSKEFEDDPARLELIDSLITARLVTASSDAEGNRVVSIAHEALLRVWPRATEWISRNSEFLRLRSSIEQAMKRWSVGQQDPSLLLPAGLPLEEGRKLISLSRNRLRDDIRSYIDQSVQRDDTIRRRAVTRRRLQVGALAFVALFFAALGLYARRQTEIANQKTNLANDESRKATEQSRIADEQKGKVQSLLEEQRKLSNAASKELFEYGISEYESGRLAGGIRKIYQAKTLCQDLELKARYEEVLLDRMTQGGSSRVRFMHDNGINAIAFSDDGLRLATSSYDKKIGLWDSSTGQPLCPPLTHEQSTSNASYAANFALGARGSRIATVSGDTAVKIWDTTNGTVVGPLLVHDEIVHRVLMSADGKRVVTVGDQGVVLLWDAESGKIVTKLIGRPGINQLKFSSNSELLAVATDDGSVHLFSAQSGREVCPPLKHGNDVDDLDISPDSTKLVIVSRDDSVSLWQLPTGKRQEVKLALTERANRVIFGPNGLQLATITDDDSVCVWDAASGQQIGVTLPHEDRVYQFAFCPDCETLAIAAGSFIYLRHIATGTLLQKPFKHEGDVYGLAFSPDGKRLASASMDHTARVWELKLNQSLAQEFNLGAPIGLTATSADQQRIAVALKEQAEIHHFQWKAGQLVECQPTLVGNSIVSKLTFCQNDRRLVSCSIKKINVWELNRGSNSYEQIAEVESGPVDAISPNGERYVHFDGASAGLVDVLSGLTVGEPLQHSDSIYCAAFSPDGRLVATGSSDKTVRLWDSATGRQVGKPLVHNYAVFHLGFSTDGDRILTVAEDSIVRQWSTATMQLVGSLLKHDGVVAGAQYYFGANLITTASYDRKARIWSADTGELLCIPWNVTPEYAQPFVSIGSDGRRIASYSYDTGVSVHDSLTGAILGSPFPNQRFVGFSPQSSAKLVTFSGGSINVWNVESPQKLPSVDQLYEQMNYLSPQRTTNLKTSR